MAPTRRDVTRTAPDPRPAGALDPGWLASATADQLDQVFRTVDTLPLQTVVNAGGHEVNLATRTIFNDEHWKGWLPRGLALRDIFTRLSTGYAKRFWKQGRRHLGETLYLDGRIRVKHALEEITLERRTHDLDAGRYILLRYTDPAFEHLFYDVMKAADDGVVVYRGYSGRFPDGRCGFTGVLMRRYAFAQLGTRDHQVLSGRGERPAPEALAGTWRLDAIATSDHATRVGTLTVDRAADGTLRARCDVVDQPSVLVPGFVADHFTTDRITTVQREVRVVDAGTMVGTWHTDIGPLYARFVSASPGLFHRDKGRGPARYTLKYVLSAESR